jgi:chromosome segregation ATPase
MLLLFFLFKKEIPMTQSTIPADVRERIIAAAADLFEQTARQTMPTVDAVRRAARVDMNAASSVMKEWRRAQTAQAEPVAVAVPEFVQKAGNAALATIWQQAQELANESLRSAQAAWETERSDLDAMRQELADAFERQADELDKAHAAADRLRTENTEARQKVAAELEAARAAESAARTELMMMQAKAEATEQIHAEKRKQAAAEAHRVAEKLTKVQGERDAAAQATAEARERAAGLAGQLQAMQEQNAALLASIQPQGEPKPKRTPSAKS